MIWLVWIPAGLFLLKALAHIFCGDDFPIGSMILVCFFGFGAMVVHTESRPEKIAQRAAEEKAREASLQPHVIREADGCKVYRWKNSVTDNWHYFTKCPLEVTTESNRTVTTRQGKYTKSEVVPEVITTERQ